MPQQTPVLSLPYLVQTDPPDIAGSEQALATATESAIMNHSVRVVSSTSDIAAPYDGMIVFATSDNRLYRYYATGTTWRKLSAYARYAKTIATTHDQPITTGSVVQFNTPIVTDPRVVAGGTNNSTFTLDPGRWRIAASLRASANAALGLYLMTSTTYDEGQAFAGNSTNSFVLVGVSDIIDFATTTTVCVGVFANPNVNAVHQGLATQGVTHVSFEREV